MRWNFLRCLWVVTIWAVAGASCSKKSGEGDSEGVKPANPDGWELVSWNGHEAIAGRIYLDLADDGLFTLYQQVGDLTTAGYTLYTGSYAFTTDPELGTLLTGSYSDGTPWARSYLVESMTGTELRMLSLDENILSIYERVVIPGYVKEPSIAVSSRSEGDEPLLEEPFL